MKYLRKFNRKSDYDAHSGLATPNVSYIELEQSVIYTPYVPPPLYIEARESLYVSFSGNDIEYSLDNISWVTLVAGNQTPTILEGEKIFFRAVGLTPTADAGIGNFSVTGECNIGGNVMSMLYGADYNNNLELPDYAFRRLFYNSDKVIDAYLLRLPSLALSLRCYNEMFSGCTNLETAPYIAATTAADYSCFSMFRGCSNLREVQEELHATVLGEQCYGYMFAKCTSLQQSSKLPATTLTQGCYRYMYYGSGLKSGPELPAELLAEDCYQGMFNGCTNLETASYISATTAADSSFSGMFRGCSNLREVQEELRLTTLASSCCSYMFYECTSLNRAPVLPAKTPVSNCYYQMFYGCSSLSYIKALLSNFSSSYSGNWINGIASTGVFVRSSDYLFPAYNSSALPSGSGWTIEVVDE